MIEINSANQLSASEKTRIPFHDIDPAGVVWHGRYFKYFELARCSLMEGIDYSYDGMKDSGFLWPVVESKIRYVIPLILSQEIQIVASLREWEFRLVVDYRILNEEGAICTKARTIQVPVNADTLELQFGSPNILIKNVEKQLDILGS